ncbi:class I SAM-dependent methyltransferase [Natronoflexus pectinivorans]|uniref:Methyltransferase family protein n=1 Tax=Natronoflexus pectinivorans TaxID=682526 RepID=A0A4R2GIR9_9BACT|nr:class I SAM-dependent methyltransferase [Natronoflexus pectinivorans]TCO08480.1 methyltransferase family protein [Natronoflexus pectinivorans]
MEHVFYELFSNLPRQGPGDTATSLQILDLVRTKRRLINRILDVGCGTGSITLELAKRTDAYTVAVDSHQPFLDELNNGAKELGIADKLQCVNADMNALPFKKGEFDLIWSEGAIYIMGLENGLKKWREFLKPHGILVVSELCWFETNPPNEVFDFWKSEYPGMMTLEHAADTIQNLGYKLIYSSKLKNEGWTINYYDHLLKNISQLRRKYADNYQALDIVNGFQIEMEMYDKYQNYYGYVFWVIERI